MKFNKGKADMIGYLFLWALSIVFAITITLILGYVDLVTGELGAEIQQESEEQNHHSTMGIIMHGEMSDIEEIETDYSKETFGKVLSIYLSSEGDIAIKGNEISRQTVEQDLETYFDHRTDQISGVNDFQLNATTTGGNEQFGEIDSGQPLSAYELKLEDETADLVLYRERNS